MTIVSEKPASTAGNILQAALHLIAERGYAAVSMRDIAVAVDIQASSIYNHFASKQDILFRLMTGHMEGLLLAWNGWRKKGNDTGERFDAFIRFHIHYHLHRPQEIFISYMELRSLEPDNLAIVKRLRSQYEAILRKILIDGKADCTVEDPAVATRALINMITGLTAWYRSDGALSAEALEQIYVNMARRSVGLPTTQ